MLECQMMWQCQITLVGVAAGTTPPARTFSNHYFQKEDQSPTFTPAGTFSKLLVMSEDHLAC